MWYRYSHWSKLKMWILIYSDHETYINTLIMFCSDLVVASPVEDYFLYINDMSDPDKVRILFTLLYHFISKNPLQKTFYLKWMSSFTFLLSMMAGRSWENYTTNSRCSRRRLLYLLRRYQFHCRHVIFVYS